MGRPKGSKNKSKGNGADSGALGVTVIEHGDNKKPALTDEQTHRLVHEWADEYAKVLKAKKAADSDLKDVGKKIKADGLKLQDIKDYLDAETSEGQEKLRGRLEAIARIARWRAFPIGTQAELFPEGLTPSMSFTQGKEAGLSGLPATAPDHANHDEWIKGWHVGQESLAADGIKQLPPEDEEDIRPAFLKDSRAEANGETAPDEF